MEKQKNDLDGAVGSLEGAEQYQELAQRALQTVLITGKQAEKDEDMRAKRCFDVQYKDGQRQCIRWILAVPAHPEFMHALNVLKQDKDTGSCANQGRGGQSHDEQGSQGHQGRSQGQWKRRWLILRPKETPKEVNKGTSTARVRLCTKTMCGAGFLGSSSQRSSSPWPGRCKLGFSHYLQCPNCPSGTCNRVWWVALWCEFEWLSLYVIRALFSSHQCCKLVGLISEAPVLCPRSRVSRTLSTRSVCRYAAMFFFPGTGDPRPLSVG